MSGYGQASTGGNGMAVETGEKAVQYVCGDCANRMLLGRSDPIRCTSCGFRVLYKERTNRMVQFEAR